ncbi:NAD(P)H-binding protein [Cobetia amphilecti]|uniref:NAD(P)H-binding protein n=1 Tax=Cobetia amphilecti TaxID=1055104 RepID=UPI001CDAC9AD|nr:NAD(P)H-binding protein [Cobetia amphilecti]UBU49466.1 NAD(P)H-binding protein [Cobetia amphilecti]
MGQTAIVIGATGVVGREVVAELIACEAIARVITLTRRPVPGDSDKVENHVVDFARLEDWAHCFQADLLFSCLGTTLKQAGSLEAQRRVDIDHQLSAARLAAAQGVTHYLLVSSSGANHASRNGYLRMKGELEVAIKALPFARISVFQPSLLVGERSEFRLGESLARYLLPVLTRLPGLQRYRPIRGAQVAARMVEVSQRQQQAHAVYRLEEVFPRPPE